MTNTAEIFLRSSVFATLDIEWEQMRIILDPVLIKKKKKKGNKVKQKSCQANRSWDHCFHWQQDVDST